MDLAFVTYFIIFLCLALLIKTLNQIYDLSLDGVLLEVIKEDSCHARSWTAIARGYLRGQEKQVRSEGSM